MEEKRARQLATVESCEIIEGILQEISILEKMVTEQCSKDIEAWKEAGTDDGSSLPKYADFYDHNSIEVNKDQIIKGIAKMLDKYIEYYAGPDTKFSKQADKIKTQFLTLNPANRTSGPYNDDETFRDASNDIYNGLLDCMIEKCEPDCSMGPESNRRYFIMVCISYGEVLTPLCKALEETQKTIAQKYFFGPENKKMTEVLRDLMTIYK